MGVRYIGVKLPTGAIRHSKTRLAQTAGRGALEPRNSCSIYIIRRRYVIDEYRIISHERAYARALNNALQAHSAQDRATAARAPCSRPNWRFGPFGAGEERPSSPAPNGPPAQLAGSHGAPVTAGPRQLGTKAAAQAGSPRHAALAEPHAASTSLLSQRPTHPAHRPGRARPRGPSRRRQKL